LQSELLFSTFPQLDFIPFYNILLFGGFGTGKSSYFNTVATAFSSDLVEYAKIGVKEGKHVTTEYFPYNLVDYGIDVPVCIYDTWGFDENNYNRDEINLMLEGDLMPLTTYNGILSTIDKNVQNSLDELRYKVHCVCFFISMNSSDNRPYIAKLKEFVEIASDKRIPYIIIMTKPDEEDPKIRKYPYLLDKSNSIKTILEETSKTLGVNMQDIYPVMNYNSLSKDPYLDVYALRAFSRSVAKSKDNLFSEYQRILIENRIKNRSRENRDNKDRSNSSPVNIKSWND